MRDPREPVCLVTGVVQFDDATVDTTGTPVADCEVWVNYRGGKATVTDDQGRYELVIPMRHYDMEREKVSLYVVHSIAEKSFDDVWIWKNRKVVHNVNVNKAELLESGKAVEGRINGYRTARWYRIDAIVAQTIRVELQQNVNEVDPYIELYPDFSYEDKNAPDRALRHEEEVWNRMWEGYDRSDTSPISITSGNRQVLEPGIYYIKISDDLHNEYSDVVYTLSVFVENSDEGEPYNNTKNGARASIVQQLIPDGSTSHTLMRYIGHIGDIDWYWITLYEGYILRTTVTTNNPTMIDPNIALIDTENNALWETENTSDVTQISEDSGNRGITKTGDYYICISDVDNDEYDAILPELGNPYIVTISIEDSPEHRDNPAEDRVESANNVILGAVTLTNDTVKQGYIGHIEDVDWFEIEAYDHQVIKVVLTQEASNVIDPDVVLGYIDTGNMFRNIWTGNYPGGISVLADSGYWAVKADTNQLIRIADREHDEFDSVNTYSVAVSIRDEPDGVLYEPGNNEKTDAKPLKVDSITATSKTYNIDNSHNGDKGYIGSIGDMDWFQIDALRGQIITVYLQTSSSGTFPLIPRAVLYQESTNLWEASIVDTLPNGDLDNPSILDSNKRGITLNSSVYIRISCDLYTHSLEEYYELTVTVEDNPEVDTDPFITYSDEPDNNFKENPTWMTMLPVTATERYISHIGDVDWYRMDLSDGDTIAVTIGDDGGPNVDVTVELIPQFSDTVLLTVDETTGSPNNEYLVTSDGLYYVKIYDDGNDGCSTTEIYSFTVSK